MPNEPLHHDATGAADVDPDRFLAALEAKGRRHDIMVEGAHQSWRLWGSGVPLVLVHGGHGSWLHWAGVIDGLAAAATVACLDLPGYGDSEPLPGEADPLRFVEAAAAGVDALFGPTAVAHIAGFSFGGIVAAGLAAHLGGRIASLSLIGTGGLGPRPDLPMRSRRGDQSPAQRDAVHRHNLAALMIADPRRIDRLAVAIQQRNTARRPGVVSRDFSLSPILPGILKEVACPVLAAWGAQDATLGRFRDAKLAMLAQASPRARLVFIPDCGHWTMHEQPERTCEMLVDQMRRSS